MSLASKQGQVTYLKQGEQGPQGPQGPTGPAGQDGEKGPAIRGPRDWTKIPNNEKLCSGKAGEDFIDVVVYNNNYYLCTVTHYKTSTWNSSYWNVNNSFEFVATNLLLANYARIENLGCVAIEMDGFTAKNGVVTCTTGNFTNVTVTGTINATAGSIGAFKIDGNGLTNVSSSPKAYINIERSGGRYLRINDSTSLDSMLSVRSDDGSTAVQIQSYGSSNNTTGLYIICNSANVGYAIKAYGNVLFSARSNEHTKINGLCLNVQRFTSTTTIPKNVDIAILNYTADGDINLPSNPEDGKIIFMKKICGRAITVKGGTIRDAAGTATTSQWLTTNIACMFVYDGSVWNHFYCG